MYGGMKMSQGISKLNKITYNGAKLLNQKGRKIIFVFKLILYTLVGLTKEKIALVVQYCLKPG